MKVYIYTFFVSLVMYFSVILQTAVSAYPPEKYNEDSFPDFQNVDVVIIYKHNGEEYLENVDVFDKTKNERPYLLITIKELGRSEIRILEDMSVFIYDHGKDKLLKSYYYK